MMKNLHNFKNIYFDVFMLTCDRELCFFKSIIVLFKSADFLLKVFLIEKKAAHQSSCLSCFMPVQSQNIIEVLELCQVSAPAF